MEGRYLEVKLNVFNTVYVEIFARRKFSPMHAVGEIFPRTSLNSENFDTFVHFRAPPTTSWKVTHTIGEIKFGKIFVSIHSMSLW